MCVLDNNLRFFTPSGEAMGQVSVQLGYLTWGFIATNYKDLPIFTWKVANNEGLEDSLAWMSALVAAFMGKQPLAEPWRV